MKIIDFHVHAGQFKQLREDIQALLTARPMEEGADVQVLFSESVRLEEYLRHYGVERAIVLAECGPGTNFSIDSRMITEMVGNSTMLIPFGSINPNHHADPVSEFERSIELGVRGFKFYPADHSFDPLKPAMMEVYRRCEKAGLSVVFHTGTTAQKDTEQTFIHPYDFKPIVEMCPELVVILAHAGKPSWCAEALLMTEEYENVYVDTALVDISRLIALGLQNRPARFKVLYGSDWPVCGGYGALLQRIEKARLPEELQELIFYRNGADLLVRLSLFADAMAA